MRYGICDMGYELDTFFVFMYHDCWICFKVDLRTRFLSACCFLPPIAKAFSGIRWNDTPRYPIFSSFSSVVSDGCIVTFFCFYYGMNEKFLLHHYLSIYFCFCEDLHFPCRRHKSRWV
jgi:hypothetical protein